MPTPLRAFAFLLPVSIVAAGCTNAIESYKPPAPLDAPSTVTRETLRAREYIRTLNEAYRQSIEEAMRDQRLIDIPLIGLAAGTLASVVYKGSKDLTLGLGLAAGTIGAYRVYFSPQTRVQAYSKGAKATDCVSQNFEKLVAIVPIKVRLDTNQDPILGNKKEPTFDIDKQAILKADRDKLSNLLASATAISSATVPPNANPTSAGAFAVAQSALRDAMLASGAAERLSRDATTALGVVHDTAESILGTIRENVDQIIRTGTLDLAAAKSALGEGVAAAAQLKMTREAIRNGTAPATSPQILSIATMFTTLADDDNYRANSAAKIMANLAKDISDTAGQLTEQATSILTTNENLRSCATL